MSSLASVADMSPPVSPAPSSPLTPLSVSRALVARCGHYIYNASSTATDSLNIDLCTGCELRAAVTSAANARTVEDQDRESTEESMLVWRNDRMVLANFELEEEGTDGCSAGFEFSLEKQKKFSRDFTLRQVEPEDLEQLIAEIAELEEDEVEERFAAAAAMDVGEGTTTTTNSAAQISRIDQIAKAKNTIYAINSALEGARARQALSLLINNNKRKRSLSVTLAASAFIFEDGISPAHRSENSYRSDFNTYRRPKKGKKSPVYTSGRWTARSYHPWLDTSGCSIDFDQWESDAMDPIDRASAQAASAQPSSVQPASTQPVSVQLANAQPAGVQLRRSLRVKR